MSTSKPRVVKDLDDLKKICQKHGTQDFFIMLNGGLKSSKYISYEDPGWWIRNQIDGSEQTFKTDGGMLKRTLIGEALEKNALCWYGF
jgi:hypothetical protein